MWFLTKWSLMKNLNTLLALLAISSVSLYAKKCKTYDNLRIKCALTVCGTINGVRMGQLLAYGSFVNLAGGQTIATGEPVVFTYDSVAPVGMTHSASPFTSITIGTSGIYSVFYRIRENLGTAISTQLYKNGVAIPGTDDSGITATIDGVFFSANAGDVITLINTGPSFILATVFNTSPAVLTLIRVA